jgi:hypothetical protein
VGVARFKAIETERASRQRTGRVFELDAASRDAAIDALLSALSTSRETAHVDPSRTLVEVAGQRWTIVALAAPPESPVPPSLRRAGAKHKQVRD